MFTNNSRYCNVELNLKHDSENQQRKQVLKGPTTE